jgi:hydroxyacylglutathione hydrolase
MKFLYGLLPALTMLVSSAPAMSEIVPGSMEVHWNPGAEHCGKAAPRPPLQVHRYNAQTFILRENPCVTSEAPFMYLLIGSRRALLIDSGDVADPRKVPLAQSVMQLLPGEAAAKLPLLVLHTHGHLDHRKGDAQFQALPNVQVVGSHLEPVKQYFGFTDWPNGVAQVDLGDRTVDVLPTPGHYVSEVSYYDRNTGLFFSGDFLLPGRLFIADKAADLASARRVVDFIKDRPVTYVLGGHIELDTDGDTISWGSSYHPHEHVLELTRDDLLGLPAVIASFNGFYGRNGVYVMLNQNRVFGAAIAGGAALLGGVVLAIVH